MLNEQKNRFLGIAAHDLRSPLGVIESAADALYQDGDVSDAESEELFGMVLRNCRSMRKLLTDFLDISRIEQGKIDIHKPK